MIKSGADELLELEGAEEDENDEGDPEDSTHHRRHDCDTRLTKVVAEAMVGISAECQAMGIGNQARSCFPVLLYRPRTRLLLPQFTQNGAFMLRGYG